MSFPLIIGGYTETECADCLFLKDIIDEDSGDRFGKECLLFGFLQGGSRILPYQRCSECIQMEEKSKKEEN